MQAHAQSHSSSRLSYMETAGALRACIGNLWRTHWPDSLACMSSEQIETALEAAENLVIDTLDQFFENHQATPQDQGGDAESWMDYASNNARLFETAFEQALVRIADIDPTTLISQD